MIIEKISGQSLHGFLAANVFKPLGMSNTSVNEITARNKVRAIGYDLYGKINNYDSFEGGSASVISTVRDLFKWDQSFYKSPLVREETLADAFRPDIMQKDEIYGDRSYGFGWWIGQYNGTKNIFHNGSFGGYKAYNEILFSDQINIIHLSNLRHSSMFGIRAGILDILNARGYKLPPRSISAWIYREKQAEGVDSMISLYHRIKVSAEKDDFDFEERELNSFGYELLRSDRVSDAIEIFKLNTKQFPN
jgi:CubicO group peptidase (beta-lactamase class C family)